MKLPITAIILTYNEEKNIKDCLDSLVEWIDEIVIVDSYSKDNTLIIVKEYTQYVVQHEFENYAIQRNWALTQLTFKNDWILNLDADHRATPELRNELIDKFKNGIPSSVDGFMVSRKTMFLNKWIKYGGHYPTYHAVMFRKGKGSCEDKSYDQHFVILGNTEILKGDIIDIITESLSTFTQRHDKWSTLESIEAFGLQSNVNTQNVIKPNKNGNPIEQRRYLKMKYYSYPIFLRVFIYFFIRYFVRFGFLDGKVGLIFHFLQGFWFRFLVDAKIYELKLKNRTNK